MPIYEYRCLACQRRASLFFRSLAVVEADPACPHCGERRLDRRMSRVWSRRSAANDELGAPTHVEDDIPFYGPSPYDEDGFGYDDDSIGDSGEDDIVEAAREARAMARMMGEPLDAEFDQALRHIEGGADPDDVFGEMDANQADEPTAE